MCVFTLVCSIYIICWVLLMIISSLETFFCFAVVLTSIPITIALIRLIRILPCLRLLKSINTDKPLHLNSGKTLAKVSRSDSSIAVFLGSGGHTGEMMKMLSKLDLLSLQRTWIYSSGDTRSLDQVKLAEIQMKLIETTKSSSCDTQHSRSKVTYLSVPRARKVGQSYFTSVFTTVYSFIVASVVLFFNKPDILLVNGPGTCIPIAYILFFYKFMGLCATKIIYVESLARVNRLSLSGKLILPIADRFIVQWPQLSQVYARAEYYGILI